MGIITNETLAMLKAMKLQAVINSNNNTDEQAIDVAILYPDWESFEEGAELLKDKRVRYKDILYKVVATHNKQATWTPDVASTLYIPIGEPEAGTKENPIVWVSGMESEKDKYYTDEGVLYIGLEDSNVGLYGKPKDLARYFKQVE